jgi:hypothetical protein
MKSINYDGGDIDYAMTSYLFGNKDAFKNQRREELEFESWQYITPEMEARMKNGQLTDEDNDYLVNKMFNPWNDVDYAMWYYNQRAQGNEKDYDAQIALEYLTDMTNRWKELEEGEQIGEVHGGTVPDNPKEPPEPPAPPLTKEDVQQAMEAAISSLPAVETGIYLDGEDVGTLIMNALFGRNVRINPEAVVAEK